MYLNSIASRLNIFYNEWIFASKLNFHTLSIVGESMCFPLLIGHIEMHKVLFFRSAKALYETVRKEASSIRDRDEYWEFVERETFNRLKEKTK
jgi:hypothetical protein